MHKERNSYLFFDDIKTQMKDEDNISSDHITKASVEITTR